MSICEVPLCTKPAHARGLCPTHYKWAESNGIIGQFERKHRPLAGRLCEVDGCGKPASGAKFCSMHSARLRLTGSIGEAQPRKAPSNQPCGVEGCERKAKAQGYCHVHYRRWRKDGDPGPAEPLRRKQGSGHITEQGYKSFNTSKNKHKFEHHRVWEAANGPIPEGKIIHHINGVRTDNRLENLLLTTQQEHRRIHAREKK